MELRTFKRTLIRARKAKPLGAWQSCFCHWPSDPEENLRRFPEKDGLFVNICSQVQDLFWIASTLIFFLFLGTLQTYVLQCKEYSMIFQLAVLKKDASCYCWILGLYFALSCFSIRISYCLSLIVDINPKWFQLTLNRKRFPHSYCISTLQSSAFVGFLRAPEGKNWCLAMILVCLIFYSKLRLQEPEQFTESR